MPYRVEVSPNSRAVCKNQECKTAAVKINKGELRFGTLITVQEHTSWTYKHWGCVTPVQIGHLQEESEGDTDMIDGYDELPADLQEKVKFALANGHVPDEDWKGDVEVNRPGQKGFRVKVKAAKKKKGKKGEEEHEEAEEPKAKKKRSRPAKEEDAEEAPAPKKARGKAKKAVVEEEALESDAEVPEPKVKKPTKGKKAAAKVEEASASEPEVPEPKAKKTARAKKASAKQESSDNEVEAEAPKPKRGRKKAAAANGEEKSAPRTRGRKRKAGTEEE